MDARGVEHRALEVGVLRHLTLDWPRQELNLEWERNDSRETMTFSLNAKTGPRNGSMREFFEVLEDVAEAAPTDPRRQIKSRPPLRSKSPATVPIGGVTHSRSKRKTSVLRQRRRSRKRFNTSVRRLPSRKCMTSGCATFLKPATKLAPWKRSGLLSGGYLLMPVRQPPAAKARPCRWSAIASRIPRPAIRLRSGHQTMNTHLSR